MATGKAQKGLARRAQAAREEAGIRSELERQTYNLSNLMEISREINGTLRLDELYTIIILTAMGHSGAQKAVLYVREGNELEVRASRGLPEGMVLPPLTEQSVFVQTASQDGSVFALADISLPAKSVDQGLAEIVSLGLVLPFINQDQCLAILLLGARYPDIAWTAEEIEFLGSIVDLGSIALANARLYAELEARLNQLSGLYEISRVINSSNRADEILRLAAETLSTGFGVRQAAFLGLAASDFVLLSGIGIEQVVAGATLSPLFESVFVLGQSMAVDEYRTNPELEAVFGQDVLAQAKMAVLVPLLAAGERVGILAILAIEGRPAGVIRKEECELFSIIGSQFAPPLLVAQTLMQLERSVADPFHPWMDLLEGSVQRAAEYGLSTGVCEFILGGIDAEKMSGLANLVEDVGTCLREIVDPKYPVMRIGVDTYALVMSGASLRDQERIVDDAAKRILLLLDDLGLSEQIRLERRQGQIPEEYPSASAWVFRRQ
jgi:GAF domain-containing protein